MITLQSINETNFMEAAALKVSENQRGFVASAPMILARAYAYREQNAICWGICEGLKLVGLAMIHDMEEDPACYHLCEFLIDEKYQNRGTGQKALQLILNHCRRERKFRRVEVCVKKTDTAAVHVYQKAGFVDSGYQDPDTPDSLCMVLELPDLEICVTGTDDLLNVQKLWVTPEVMCYVGFPEGLYESVEHLRDRWLPWLQNPLMRQHYSIYANGIGYCGESFYDIDETGLACMDIKLLPGARGKGIAFAGLAYALNEAFAVGNAKSAYVDPNPDNEKAIRLYERIGFHRTERASHLEDPGCPYVYMEISRNDWLTTDFALISAKSLDKLHNSC